MLLIKGGRVIDPASGRDEIADVVIEDGKIREICPDAAARTAGGQEPDGSSPWPDASDIQVIDATGKIVAPGLVEFHVHFRDPGLTYKEDSHTGAAAAA